MESVGRSYKIGIVVLHQVVVLLLLLLLVVLFFILQLKLLLLKLLLLQLLLVLELARALPLVVVHSLVGHQVLVDQLLLVLVDQIVVRMGHQVVVIVQLRVVAAPSVALQLTDVACGGWIAHQGSPMLRLHHPPLLLVQLHSSQAHLVVAQLLSMEHRVGAIVLWQRVQRVLVVEMGALELAGLQLVMVVTMVVVVGVVLLLLARAPPARAVICGRGRRVGRRLAGLASAVDGAGRGILEGRAAERVVLGAGAQVGTVQVGVLLVRALSVQILLVRLFVFVKSEASLEDNDCKDNKHQHNSNNPTKTRLGQKVKPVQQVEGAAR